MRYLIILTLFLLVASFGVRASSFPSIQVKFLNKKPSLYYSYVIKAMDDWNRAIGETVFYEITNIEKTKNTLRISFDKSIRHFGAMGGVFDGWNKFIHYETNFDKKKWKTVALHELGHALGLDHSRQFKDIMKENSSATVLSINDVQRARIALLLQNGTTTWNLD